MYPNPENSFNRNTDLKISDMPTKKEENKVINLDNFRQKETEKPEPTEDFNLNKSKIININDFIFRQNLEFYPNLTGLSCEDNILTYKVNGETITSEALTFDLRTLPGDAWNVSPKNFIEIIKINKSSKKLFDFIHLLNESAFDNVILNKEELEHNVSNYMNLYFSIKDAFSTLTEDNKILVSNIENMIASLPKETAIGSIVNTKLDEYLELTKTMGDEKGKAMALVLKNKNLPSLIEEEPKVKMTKAGFINIAILLYGILNIGMIVAMAIMRK